MSKRMVGGVDYSMTAIHVAIIGGVRRSPVVVTQRTYPSDDLAIRLTRLRATAGLTMHTALWQSGCTIDDIAFVMVEQPGAKYVPKHLFMAQAVIMESLSAIGLAVVSYPPPSWKKAAIGSGKATKSDVMDAAKTLGYDGTLQDEADAIMIAMAARNSMVIQTSLEQGEQ